MNRKGFTRRSARADAWLYHLRELAASEEPLRTMRKYLRVEDDLDPDPAPSSEAEPTPDSKPSKPAADPPPATKPAPAGIAIVRKRFI